MLKNYLKIAWRNFIQKKWYSFLNIGGLAIGMACSILILLWVQNESSYDTFHANADELYRLTAIANEDFKAAVSPAGMVEELPDLIPEIKSSVRLSSPFEALFEADDQKFKEESIFFADSNFLDVFTFPLIKGNPKKALAQPDGIILTETAAQKFFGTTNALGKTIKVDNKDVFTVTGILEDIPTNSHLQFNIIMPMSYYAKTHSDLINKVWDSFNFYGYFQFQKNAISSEEDLSKMVYRINEIYTSRNEFEITFNLQPLKDIHLHSDLQIDVPGHGNIQYVNIFLIVAFIILIVACINYMNLATARSSKRAKEVGLRKVIGAGRRQLVFQFLSESLVISFFSLILAIGIVFLLLPAFNDLAQKELVFQMGDSSIWITLIIIALATGLISGSYPALFLSGFKPVRVLKGRLKLSKYNLLFRNGLVIAQFVVSVLLLIGTMVIYNQLNFIKDKNLGYNKSNLLYIPMEGEIWGKMDALRAALTQNSLTNDFSIMSDLPANLVTGDFDIHWEGKDPNQQILFPSVRADENFLNVFQMGLLNGRSFSRNSFENNDYIINETAVRIMGMDVENVIGKSLTFRGDKGTIIGVVKDFNFKPLQYAIEPLVLQHGKRGSLTVIKTAPNNIENTIAALEQIYGSLNPAYPLIYNFIDTNLDAQYKGEQQMGAIFNVFALLAILISCLGLYGLSAFMAEQRFKEIGIRKVLGANATMLVNMLSKDFLKLVFIAFVLAVPLAWYTMNQWLEGYAFHIELQWWMFVLAGLIVLTVALSTVSYQSLKASMSNPIKSLRTE
ncbi:ABC transporter permease [Flagellimonas pacifica]|uniref:FtsX-like permease family protein n=1 Tax=Flagellimonas pacifica TaxID=1247520 RepID=A0A285MHF6_9FLAO|nr:ABC transporter permease [Allomuricauda parva]SNY94921.1 FtsX-like permease family protein [Allomuricauda parva]